jgi:uncharacterized protein YyaL (SSP411 family)
MMLAALSTWHAGVAQIVIVGAAGDEGTERLVREASAKYDPFSVIVPVQPGASQLQLAHLLPFIETMEMRDGCATAYVCHDFACTSPTTDPAGLAERLARTIPADS